MVVTFDVYDEELGGSVYDDTGEGLTVQGLYKTLPRKLTDSGQHEQMPRNIYVGPSNGPRAKKVREDALRAACCKPALYRPTMGWSYEVL